MHANLDRRHGEVLRPDARRDRSTMKLLLRFFGFLFAAGKLVVQVDGRSGKALLRWALPSQVSVLSLLGNEVWAGTKDGLLFRWPLAAETTPLRACDESPTVQAFARLAALPASLTLAQRPIAGVRR